MRVVFVHGACVRDGAWWWHRTAELLSERGVPSVAPLLPSCGESGRAGGAGGPGLPEDVASVRVIPSIEDLLAAPIGVALLDRLEAKNRHESFRPFDAFPDSKPNAVRDAVQQVESISLGALLSLALEAAEYLAGPWNPGGS